MPDTTIRTTYDELIQRTKETSLLASVGGLLGWDQETMMPPRGLPYRGEQNALIARLAHERRTDPRIGELLSACEADSALVGDSTSDAAVNVRELRRSYDRATRLPASLVRELAQTTTLAKHAWAEARRKDDFNHFKPWLEKVLDLTRQKAQCFGYAADGEPWDALADGYEPGMTAKGVAAVFSPLRDELVALLGKVRNSKRQLTNQFHGRRFDQPAMLALVRQVAAALGFDFEAGRLDVSTHPFCGGTHYADVRMTTRFDEPNAIEPLYSTMHEAGHGLYNQSLPAAHLGTPLGEPVGLSVHESQSRLIENLVGRSRAFVQWIEPHLRQAVGRAMDGIDHEAFYASVNLAKPSFIRVEADELTYNLHIMIRFELERALVAGSLDVGDLPEAWNTRYREYLGLDVPSNREGCLQDIHWSMGAMGYFPTYTMGNLLAAQLFEAMTEALPDVPSQIAAGDFSSIRRWLNEHVHAHGKRYRTAALCQRVTGRPLTHDALIRHLTARTAEVYSL